MLVRISGELRFYRLRVRDSVKPSLRLLRRRRPHDPKTTLLYPFIHDLLMDRLVSVGQSLPLRANAVALSVYPARLQKSGAAREQCPFDGRPIGHARDAMS